MNNTMFGVDLCKCDDPYKEGPFDGIVFCETCHGVVSYAIEDDVTQPESGDEDD